MPVRMTFDWVEASPSADALAQSTMAALTIEVDGSVVTSVLDRRSRSCREHVVTPLGYVAEWLVGNWWRLFHEVEDPRAQRLGFAEAHDLAFVGEGYLLPSLTITPTPQQMRLRWRRHRPLHSTIEFTEQGEALVDREELEGALGRLVDVVRDRLAGNGLAGEFLNNEWSAIQAVAEDEREFCRAAALLGQDPFAVPQPLAEQLIDFWRRAEPTIREDALATANGAGFASLAPLAGWLTEVLQSLSTTRGGDWAEFRDALPTSTAREPYRRGYDLARAARGQLGQPSERYEFSTTGPEAIPCAATQPPTSTIQGLVAADSPACAIADGRGTSKRFLLARALGDYLGRTEQGPAILSGLATDRQAQSRAFAAEFLAPADALRQRLRREQVPPDLVDDLAHEYGVSSYVVRHQIENHHLAHIAEW